MSIKSWLFGLFQKTPEFDINAPSVKSEEEVEQQTKDAIERVKERVVETLMEKVKGKLVETIFPTKISGMLRQDFSTAYES